MKTLLICSLLSIVAATPLIADTQKQSLKGKIPEQVYIDCEQAAYDLEVEVKDIGKFIGECLGKRGYDSAISLGKKTSPQHNVTQDTEVTQETKRDTGVAAAN